MKLYDIIFTKQSPGKYYRHILFLGGWFLFLVADNLIAINSNYQKFPETRSALYMLTGIPLWDIAIEIVFIYGLVYFILPKLLPGKKLWLLVIIPVYIVLCFICFYYVQDKTSTSLLLNVWFDIGKFIGVGPVFVAALFIALRIVKNYYLRMEEKEALEQENTNAELQFLKAQVHPHFLFNTLNNIYSFTLTRSPQAITLVRKLKALLNYMTDECKADKVLFEKELNMLTDYIALEKVRYGEKLDIQVAVTGDYENVMITPLLMIPFVENSFKHGASKLLNNPWIKINIELDQNDLYFSIYNNKPAVKPLHSKRGIGLENITKRLQLLYPHSHSLIIEETAEIFTIKMRLTLQTIQETSVAA